MIVQNVSDHGITDISFTLPHDDLDETMEAAGALAADIGAAGVSSDHRIGRVSLVGAGMKSNPGVAATVFETLAEHKVNIEMISTSAIRISCVIAEDDLDRATIALHSAFELDA